MSPLSTLLFIVLFLYEFAIIHSTQPVSPQCLASYSLMSSSITFYKMKICYFRKLTSKFKQSRLLTPLTAKDII